MIPSAAPSTSNYARDTIAIRDIVNFESPSHDLGNSLIFRGNDSSLNV